MIFDSCQKYRVIGYVMSALVKKFTSTEFIKIFQRQKTDLLRVASATSNTGCTELRQQFREPSETNVWTFPRHSLILPGYIKEQIS